MGLTIENSANYAAQIVRIETPFKLENSDRLYGLTLFGYTAIVDASWLDREGQLAVFFPAEAQLSHEYVSTNGLYRHSDLNVDPTQTGYLEDNRRVRALKLRGNTSSGLLMLVDSLSFVKGFDPNSLAEGDRFDTINGAEISRKYVVKEPQVHDRQGKKIKQAFKRVDVTLMPEHIETDQWLRNEQIVGDDEILIVTQKLHGTSARFANTIVKREMKWWERLLVKSGVKIRDTDYDTVAGSRKSIKDPNNPNQKHFYGEDAGDLWTDYLKRIEEIIPKGYIVYGEIIGWTKSGAPIQKGHTYDLEAPVHTSGVILGHYNKLYVYRVATVNPDGELSDLSWDQVRRFCAVRGLKTVPELWRGFKKDFDLNAFVEMDFASDGLRNKYLEPLDRPVPLSKGGTDKDEGIAIRVDGGQIPMLFKYKNDSHYLYETAQLDSGEVDLESAES